MSVTALAIRLPRAISRRRRRGPLERYCLRMFLVWLGLAIANIALTPQALPLCLVSWAFALPCGYNITTWFFRWRDARGRGQ